MGANRICLIVLAWERRFSLRYQVMTPLAMCIAVGVAFLSLNSAEAHVITLMQKSIRHEIGTPQGKDVWVVEATEMPGLAAIGTSVTSLRTGRAWASCDLHISPATNRDKTVCRIEVRDKTSGTTIASKNVRARDILTLRRASVMFNAPGNNHELEFRVISFGATAFQLSTMQLSVPDPDIKFHFDQRRLQSIVVDGKELLTGGGCYLIGSLDGDDKPSTNVTSGGSDGRYLLAPGMGDKLLIPYVLNFKQVSPTRVDFRISVGPVPVEIASMNLAIDARKELFDTFQFSASGYKVGCAHDRTLRDGDGGAFASIPTPCRIVDKGVQYGSVGLAGATGEQSWGAISGKGGTLTLQLTPPRRGLSFTNHPSTNNIGLGFGKMSKGDTVEQRGSIVWAP